MRAIALVLVCLTLGLNPVSYADEGRDESQMPMMEKEMMNGKMGMMKGGMMGMMQKSMVASADGGVIILSGNKLLKYDTNLQLMKEASLPAPDMAEMQNKMGDMKAKCPMCGGMMGKDGKTANKSADVSQASSDADHASHH